MNIANLLKGFLAIGIIVAIFSYQIYRILSQNRPKPVVDLNEYWGRGDVKNYKETTSIKPFKVLYDDATIDRLKRRLEESAPLAEPLEGVAFEYGFNSKKLKDIVNFWKNDYLPRWKEREEYLNQFPHFTTQIQGLNLHYIHVKPKVSKDTKVYPIMLLNGWPSSVREYYDLIVLLTKPSKDNIAFEVIAPSIPGFGFSEAAAKKGFGTTKISIVLRNLMLRIGIDKFYIQSSDWGSIITSNLASLFPENVLGYHTNMPAIRTPLSFTKTIIAAFFPSYFIEDKTKISWMYPLSDAFTFLLAESGYFHIQATKPDTIGIALSNNPVGLAAYILEKVSTATNPNYRQLADGGFEKSFSMDALLDNVMIYYLTNCITTSVRIYKEGMSPFDSIMGRVAVTVPSGFAHFRHEIQHHFKFLLGERFKNIVHDSYFDEGGHFPALEMPKVLYQDILEFVNKTL